MTVAETQLRIRELEAEIAALPRGNVSVKTIKGRQQPYLQWTENGRRISRFIKADEREDIFEAIRRRDALTRELTELRDSLPHPDDPDFDDLPDIFTPTILHFHTRVQTGVELQRLCETVRGFRTRDCFGRLERYLTNGAPGRVCLLYGLRRTGKTTMILQAASHLPPDRTAYIKITQGDTFAGLEDDISVLSRSGFLYIFVDEVTLLRDFIDTASVLSDIYAMMGIRIVLSGTDSLGFALSAADELYDRACTIHTTYIPFREYSRILGINDIDEYIRYGGTFRVGETDFDGLELGDESVSFRDDESTRRYIDTSIARNIQHSLAHYRHGTRFRHLIDLYDAGELTSAVNRIIEDMNHSFLLSVLTRDFISHDLGISRQNLQKERDPAKRSRALAEIDTDEVTDRLMHILDIRNRANARVGLTADHVAEIKEYLYMLDLITDCPIRTAGGEQPVEHIIFTQPGMRYSQAQALVHSLMKDPVFAGLDYEERTMVTDRILQEVRGRMMEEIVLLETSKALGRQKDVFRLQFADGEFDMVIAGRDEPGCGIYEIKHSMEAVPEQYRFLIDEKKCRQTEHRFGPIQKRSVIYRGKPGTVDGIEYINVEEYLTC